MRHKTFRSVRQAGVRMRSLTSRQTAVPGLSVNDNNQFIADVSAPSEIAPGGILTIEVTAANRRSAVFAGNPNRCRTGVGQTYGIEETISVSPSWAGSDESVLCMGSPLGGGVATETVTFEYTAPDSEGTYTYSVGIELPNGDQAETTFSILVSEDAGRTPPADDDDDDDDDDQNNDGWWNDLFGDSGGLGGQVQGVALLLLLIVGLGTISNITE